MTNATGPGRLILSNNKERHATWLELFFDLVFVVTVSGLSRHLVLQHTPIGIIEYIFLFLVIWWQWMGMSYYADQFDNEDRIGHLCLFAVMLCIILLNVYLSHAFSIYTKQFALIYICMRLVLILQYCRSYYDSPDARELIKKYIIGFSIAACCWLSSLFFHGDTIFLLWTLGIFIDVMTPPCAYLTAKHIPAQVSHMDERFGLFVIIVLGETIVNVAQNLMRDDLAISHMIMTIIGFCVVIVFWKLYFSKNAENIIHNALRRKGKSLFLSFIYGYGHLFIFVSIVAFGAGLQLFVLENLRINADGLRIMIVSMVVFYVTNKLIQQAAIKTLVE